jgi:hypothetical protein
MNIRNNPLECRERKPFEWILNQRYKYLHQILGAYCEDGTLLWDLIENDNENHNSSTTIDPTLIRLLILTVIRLLIPTPAPL